MFLENSLLGTLCGRGTQTIACLLLALSGSIQSVTREGEVDREQEGLGFSLGLHKGYPQNPAMPLTSSRPPKTTKTKMLTRRLFFTIHPSMVLRTTPARRGANA